MKKKKIFYFVFIIVLIFTISCLLFSNYALANEGIKVKVVPAGTDKAKILPIKKGMMQLSLFTGAGQYYALMGLGVFGSSDWGPQPLRLVFACPQGSIAGMMVRGDSGIKTLSDLKGKRVVLIPASPACKSLHEGYLAFGGLSWDDVKVVNVSSWGGAWLNFGYSRCSFTKKDWGNKTCYRP